MRSRLIVATLICACAILVLTVSGFGGLPGDGRSIGPGTAPISKARDLKKMIDLKLKDLSGRKYDSEDLKGKVSIIDFWATWCGPCVAEVPEYNDLQRQFAGQGLQVVGVALASGKPSEVKPYVTRFKMSYSVLVGDDDQAYDLNIAGFPTTYVVTKDWRVYKVYSGASRTKAQQLQADIKGLLAQ